MPDDDRLPRSLTGRWRRIMKAFQAGEPPEDIAYHVARATADTLRRTHGITDLPALGVQLQQAAADGLSGNGRADSPRVLPTRVPGRLARQAADALSAVMRDRLALTSPESAALILARRVVADVAYSFGLDRMAPFLVAGGHNAAELHRQFESLAQSNPLGELARRLLAHPDGKGLRAPGRRRPRLATADLMEIDVGELL